MPLGENGLCGYRMSSVSPSAWGDADIKALCSCGSMNVL